ncbi:MAG: M61 family metallopeptidase [Bacteroidetes bacterium]|nr:M61 family metallopeptidase [Bacteroidota bacterium]
MAVFYKLSAGNPVTHFAEIEMRVLDVDAEEISFQLPSWRPGRYELGNFAKNVRGWKAFNGNNQALPFTKVTKDCWKVSTEGANEIIIRYEYYCAQLDAGSCWIDEDQVYINPVHCFMHVPEKVREECVVELNLPKNYIVASSMQKSNEHTLVAADYDELVDSPFIASPTIQHRTYEVDGTTFYIWLQGDAHPDWSKIIHDFTSFTEVQIKMMGDFPVDQYHFLIQLLPTRFYHGVEHLRSTVLALGPGSNLMKESLYTDFIGVASHELYHVWNIKTIRPAEMKPYDYTGENYSRLGYVYEGVTTYYGDLFLARSGVYSVPQFFTELNFRLQKHFDNPGRFNLSVADSSFDTWLDGYIPGAPGRKTSIYDEGSLVSLMTDMLLRHKTKSAMSLDDVMRALYKDFGKRHIGYTDHDYISLVGNVAGESMADFFLDYVYGTEDDRPKLEETLSYAGIELGATPSEEDSERFFGFKTITDGKSTKVSAVYPGSPAFVAGLGREDEIIAIDEKKVEDNLQELLVLCRDERIVITVLTPMKKLKDIAIAPDGKEYYPRYALTKMEKATPDQQRFFKSWLGVDFYE